MRKTSFTILLTVFAFAATFGQRFSLSELIKLNNQDWDDFDTYVVTKGYQYQETDDNDLNEAKAYSFDTNKTSSKAPYFISKTFYKKTNLKAVAFQTLKMEEYLAFKTQLKTLGFKYVGAQTTEQATFLDYKKGMIEVSLASFKAPNDSGEMLTGYEISVVTPQ